MSMSRDQITGNAILWGLFGVPALLAWIGYALAWLLAPRLVMEVNYLMWAAYAAGGWYVLMFVIFGGWFALFAVSLSF